MIALLSPSHNPYFNIGLEYYLLHELDEDVLLVYRNETSVIVGKHQNAFAEANQQFIHQANIPLVRRISGGGTVFHDLGNINITLIRKGTLMFNDLLMPLRSVLLKINTNPVITDKNDLLLDGKKITGTAAHIYKEKTLHHATLLYNASQELLHESLKGAKDCFMDKGVRSRPSPTVNLIEYLNEKQTNEKFVDFIYNELMKVFDINTTYGLNALEINSVNELVNQRFATWEWNYAYSPSFEYVNTVRSGHQTLHIKVNVKRGVIEKATVRLDKEQYDVNHLVGNLFVQTEMKDALAEWCKKNCPTVSLSSIEKLLHF